MISFRFSFAATVFVASSLQPSSTVPAQFSREQFHSPPLEARPSYLLSLLNGYDDHRQITQAREEMKANGMRGAIIWDAGALINPEHRIPAGPKFLGPVSLMAIHHAMDEAERPGLELSLFGP